MLLLEWFLVLSFCLGRGLFWASFSLELVSLSELLETITTNSYTTGESILAVVHTHHNI